MTYSSPSDNQASQAFSSTMQTIYEELVIGFADAVATLQRLQAESPASLPPAPDDRAAPPPAPSTKAASTALSQTHLHTVPELVQQVEQALLRNGVPSQAALADVMRELDQLHAAIDRRLAAQRAATEA